MSHFEKQSFSRKVCSAARLQMAGVRDSLLRPDEHWDFHSMSRAEKLEKVQRRPG